MEGTTQKKGAVVMIDLQQYRRRTMGNKCCFDDIKQEGKATCIHQRKNKIVGETKTYFLFSSKKTAQKSYLRGEGGWCGVCEGELENNNSFGQKSPVTKGPIQKQGRAPSTKKGSPQSLNKCKEHHHHKNSNIPRIPDPPSPPPPRRPLSAARPRLCDAKI